MTIDWAINLIPPMNSPILKPNKRIKLKNKNLRRVIVYQYNLVQCG